MDKYEWTPDAREISGFGGQYEKAARAMVSAGLVWLDANPEARDRVLTATSLSTPGLADFFATVDRASGAHDGDTSAMMAAAVSHMKRAMELGWERYQEVMCLESKREREEKPARTYLRADFNSSLDALEEAVRKGDAAGASYSRGRLVGLFANVLEKAF